MTLCIAAICKENDEPRIILCADRRVETFAAGAEIGSKVGRVTPGWPALFAADDVAMAHELLNTFDQYLGNVELTESNIFDELKKPPQLQKRKLAEQFVQNKLGVSYEYFLNRGKQELDDSVFRGILFSISQISLECQLIIAGFLRNEPRIFTVDKDGSVRSTEHFAAIGSGATIAEPALFQREHDSHTPLGNALYHVYEAAKLSQIAPAVGKTNFIFIIQPTKDTEKKKPLDVGALTGGGFLFLEKQYRRYGPKKFRGQINFLKEHFFFP